MTRDEILAAILDEAGNPDTGVVRDIAGALADRLDRELNPAPAAEPVVGERGAEAFRPAKETR